MARLDRAIHLSARLCLEKARAVMNDAPAQDGGQETPRLWPWLLAAVTASTAIFILLLNPVAILFHGRVHFWSLYLIAVAINLVLAGITGRLRNWGDHQTVRVIGLSVAIPLIVPIVMWFFMIFFGCALWNTLAGRYQCGL